MLPVKMSRGASAETTALAALRGRQRRHELAREVLLGAEHAKSGQRAAANLGRVRAEERRRHADAGRRDGDVQRHVVTLEAPRPSLRQRRLAEQHDLVVADAARQARRVEHPEDLLELHDLDDLEIAARAQERRQEPVRQPPLLAGHQIERHADTLRRPIGPVAARFVAELEREVLAFVEAEQRLRAAGTAGDGREQRARRLDHVLRRRDAARLLCRGRGGQQGQAGQEDRWTTHARPLSTGVVGSSYFFAVTTTRPRSRPVSTSAKPASSSVVTTQSVGSRSLR